LAVPQVNTSERKILAATFRNFRRTLAGTFETLRNAIICVGPVLYIFQPVVLNGAWQLGFHLFNIVFAVAFSYLFAC
jgi:hypothetical protein